MRPNIREMEATSFLLLFVVFPANQSFLTRHHYKSQTNKKKNLKRKTINY